MKTLIVYSSFSGNNEMLALDLKIMLNCNILRIKEIRKRTGFSIFLDIFFNRTPRIEGQKEKIKDYDHVILIAPVWAGKIASPLKSFLLKEKNNIRRYSFITACGGSQDQKTKIENELTRFVGKKPVAVTELSIRDLLQSNQKNNIKNVTAYRLKTNDLSFFASKIRDHVKLAQAEPLHSTILNQA
ncbi:MAG TPA: flavodoxin domain-containing protein [Chryseolinea sp.]|nr:flavodoxin domain-containing protein [Chryseolinea sp.]